MVVILKVILELAGDCNNYSHNQRSPYFEYGIYSHTQRPHTYEWDSYSHNLTKSPIFFRLINY